MRLHGHVAVSVSTVRPVVPWLLLLLSLCCAALVLWSLRYFTGFTWTNGSDLHPCQLSNVHLVHFAATVLSSVPLASPTHDRQLLPHLTASAAGPTTAVPSSAELVTASHSAGYRLLRYVMEYAEEAQDDGAVRSRPLLFLHDSSGSHHQANGLFSRLSLLHHREQLQAGSVGPDLLDYFSIDWAEERSALSGALLLRQAHFCNEVLRTLAHRYTQRKPFEGSGWSGAVVVAHGMGGIVARLLPLLSNRLPGSVKVVYSLGVPHAAPALVVDEDMRSVYIALSARTQAAVAEAAVAETVVPVVAEVEVSVAGGVNDFQVEPALTLLATPGTLNAVAHAVPHVDTSVEHHALCWCRQLMEVLAVAVRQTAASDGGRPASPFATPDARHNVGIIPFSPPPVWHKRGLLHSLHEDVVRGSRIIAMQLRADGSREATAQVVVYAVGKHEASLLAWVDGPNPAAVWCAGPRLTANCSPAVINPMAVSYPLQRYLFQGLIPHWILYHTLPPAAQRSTQSRQQWNTELSTADFAYLLLTDGAVYGLLSLEQSDHQQELPVVEPSRLWPSAELPSGGAVTAGLYVWSASIPAGVDRYYDLQLHLDPAYSTAAAARVWLHFASVRADPARDDAPEQQQQLLITELNVSTVIRFYRCPYDRYASGVIRLPQLVVAASGAADAAAVYELRLQLSSYSYLRTLFLQLPLLPRFLLSAALLLLACQHQRLRATHVYPGVWQMLVETEPAHLVQAAGCTALLLALVCPGTMFHAQAFAAASTLPPSFTRSLMDQLTGSRLFRHVNRNETGIACVVLLLSCCGLLLLLDRALRLATSGLSWLGSAVRARVPASMASSSVVETARIAALLALSVALPVSMLSHVDRAAMAHFGLSLSSAAGHAVALLAAAPKPVAALLSDQTATGWLTMLSPYGDLPMTAMTARIVLLVAAFLLVQAVLWQPSKPAQCAYQLSCTTLMLVSLLQALPAFLVAGPGLSLSAAAVSAAPVSAQPQLVTVAALQLVLLAASSAAPEDCHALQPIALGVYGAVLLLLHDPTSSLQSLLSVSLMLSLCWLPQALRCCTGNVLAAVSAAQTHRRTRSAGKPHAD